eukprot:TRINITY_DN1187_c0_g3_i1.p1 TRINITY_DN1187_c0_g3~~TRINITY_DN1187_c0_g3_i1.p1  ORF type:complete len:131 (-),score=34.75 TRINITY_DN1187_c0_g3_i1:16-363(-)
MAGKLFVGGLNFDTDEQRLREAFEKYGGVAEVKIIHDQNTGRSKGFGFVSFEEASAAEEAIREMNSQVCTLRFLPCVQKKKRTTILIELTIFLETSIRIVHCLLPYLTSPFSPGT